MIKQNLSLFRKVQVKFLSEPKIFDIWTKVLRKIEMLIPKVYVTNIEVIYVGHFDEIKERNVVAMSGDGAIYVDNEIADKEVLLHSLMHEIAHNIYDLAKNEVGISFEDIMNEFFGKKKRLQLLLGADNIEFPRKYVFAVDYDKDFDEYLYQDITYEKLGAYSMNLFLSPYSITSFEDYFVEGVVEFYTGNQNDVRRISPKIHEMIDSLEERVNI